MNFFKKTREQYLKVFKNPSFPSSTNVKKISLIIDDGRGKRGHFLVKRNGGVIVINEPRVSSDR